MSEWSGLIDEISELRELVDAADWFVHGPIYCACSGPAANSLPGECACATAGRIAVERLAAAIDAVKALPFDR